MLLTVIIAEISEPKQPFMLQGQPYAESLKKAAACGYEGIEIQLRRPQDIDEEFFDLCDSLHLRLTSIATGLAVRDGLSLSSPDEALRERSVRHVCDMIDLSNRSRQRPDVVIGLMSGSGRDCPDRESFLHNLGGSLKAISDYAAGKDIRVGLEPVNHIDCPEGPNTWDDAVALLDRYDCSQIFLTLDLYHMGIDEKDIPASIRRYGHRVKSVQLTDRNRQTPGRGDFDFGPILEAIKSTGYDGPIIMECLPLPDADTALQEAAAFYHREFQA